jgi:mannose-6-phosphate isomerase-like protein (cupin superfamily)
MLDPLLDRFASALARDMNTTVNINCYASWPAKQGFDTHYDRHDVFVVQVAGRKVWKVFEPTRRWPLESERGPTSTPEGLTPSLECTLTPGDVLYVPRGHWHYALAETPSIHLTVGPTARTGIDFLAWLAERLTSTDELFRKDVPLPGARALGGSRPETELLAHWRELRDRLVEILADDATLGGFLQFCMTRNPTRRAYQLPHLVLLEDEITLETRFVLAPDQKALVRYDPESRSATVTIRGHVLNFAHVPLRLLEVFFGMTGEIRGADLVSAAPELKPEEIRRFLLQMFQQGILRLDEGESG